MIRLPRFRYYAPHSLGEAVALLSAAPGSAAVLGGGTDLVPKMKRRQWTPEVLVSLRGVAELIRQSRSGAVLQIGAGVTIAELARDVRVKAEYAALFRAASKVATPQIRNVATLGGNLCVDTRCNYYDQSLEWRRAIGFCMKAPRGRALGTPDGGVCWVAPGSERCRAVSSSDLAPALIALGANLLLVGKDGTRKIPCAELYADDGMDFLKKRPEEILTGVELSASEGVKSTYWKLRRRGAFDFPALGVAAAVKLGTGGVVLDARVVLGAVASRPLLVPTGTLLERELTDDVIAAFAEEAARLAKPLDNTDFALGWRKRIARTFLAGALHELRGDDPSTFGLLAKRGAGE